MLLLEYERVKLLIMFRKVGVHMSDDQVTVTGHQDTSNSVVSLLALLRDHADSVNSIVENIAQDVPSNLVHGIIQLLTVEGVFLREVVDAVGTDQLGKGGPEWVTVRRLLGAVYDQSFSSGTGQAESE